MFSCTEEYIGKKKTEGRTNNNREEKTAGRVFFKIHSSIEEKERGQGRRLEKEITHREAGKRDSFNFISSLLQIEYIGTYMLQIYNHRLN